MTNNVLLQAFDGKNSSVPVWFMRQAGRYLPSYRAIKAERTLEEMFENPEIVSEITCQPVDILGVDAAILFADILTLPKLMGMNIYFDKTKGPIVEPLKNISSLKDFTAASYLKKAIELTKERLNDKVPLIGFAGGPFTVATYMIEGGSSTDFLKTRALLKSQPDDFRKLMDLLTDNTIRYLNYQKAAGIDVFQIFDTWAGILTKEEYSKFVLPCVQKIFAQIDLPSIYFIKNNAALLDIQIKSGADFLSICHTVDLKDNEVLLRSSLGVQGNLDVQCLYNHYAQLEKDVQKVLSSAKKYKKFIFNLGHGLLPDIDPEKVKFVVKKVHEYSWTKNG